jgi:hypothetical protein
VISSLASRVLLKSQLGGRCRVQLAASAASADVVLLPRPPELISLAGVKDLAKATLVYPDPPIGAEEQRLFKVIAPAVRLRSMTEWLAETTT